MPFRASLRAIANSMNTTSRVLRLPQLVEAEVPHPQAIRESLGDGWVLANVPMLARQRAHLRARGYRFVSDETQSPVQRMLPGFQLLSMLRTREIPFKNTRAAIDELVAHGTLEVDVSAFCTMCQVSYTFHEGAHAHFIDVVEDGEGRLEGRRLTEALLASEAYAIAFNIVSLLQGMIDDEPSTRAMLRLNVSGDPLLLAKYEAKRPGTVTRLRELATAQVEPMMRLLSTGCLFSMLRPRSVGAKPELVRRVMEMTGFPPANFEEASALTEMAMNLERDFREEITIAFFHHVGLLEEYQALLALPLEAWLQPGAIFHDYLPKLVRA